MRSFKPVAFENHQAPEAKSAPQSRYPTRSASSRSFFSRRQKRRRNKERAKELFTSAIESALALDPASKESGAAARRILALASRRDRDFAGQLTVHMLQQREKDYRAASTTVAAALDLLNVTRRLRSELRKQAHSPGLPVTPRGLSSSLLR